jgi:hypothetical protein
MENFLLYLKESWILLGVTIIIFGAIIRVTKWGRKMRIIKICNKIINDFNAMAGSQNRSDWRPILMEKYKLSSDKAMQCITYLKENGFLVKDPTNITTFCWIKQ